MAASPAQVLAAGTPDAGTLQVLVEQLRESEERFRTMADCSPVLLWLAEPDALCTFFNKVWLDFTGRSMEDELGNGWAEGVHPEDFQRCMLHYMDSFVARQPFRMEYRLRRADGQYRWLLDTGVPRFTPAGAFAGYVGSCIDITEMREATEALRRMNEELERRVQERTAELRHMVSELEQFAYVTSHDLQAPLRAITSYIGLLAKRHSGRLDGEAQEFLGYVAEGASRMRDLISDLLRYSRTGRGELELRAVDGNRVLAGALKNLEAVVQERGAQVDAGPLPTVQGDETQLLQLLQNLLDNATKFARRGHAPEVRVRAVRDGDAWHFTVRDNGIGIAPEHHDKIFGVFRRLHRQEDFSGTGIGLAICKKVVERHGGRIWVESAPGEGSAFHFTLPAG